MEERSRNLRGKGAPGSFQKMVDTWKDIPGYDGKYQADTEGNIRRVYKSGKTRLMTAYKKKMSGSQRLVVKLTKDGKSKEVILMQVIAQTFLGECPIGYVPYHKNGVQSDNYVNNIGYISRKELGKITGAKSKRQGVAKIDAVGVIDYWIKKEQKGKLMMSEILNWEKWRIRNL